MDARKRYTAEEKVKILREVLEDGKGITRLHLRTARAWQIKETASTLWDYAYTGVAEKNRKKLLGWINRCRIDEIKKVGKTIKNYWGIR